MIPVAFPLLRLMYSGNNLDDAAKARARSGRPTCLQTPANQPFDLVPANIDETKVMGMAVCPSCESKLTLTMAEYAAFRLHKRAHLCMSCATAFTAEHADVHRFLAITKHAPLTAMAGTRIHPKMYMLISK
ncbi:hypothetical protein GGF32_006570 [Allomyces javanicus]|nr:hypothetical protein GGF32_006570 [Allomyces javanicus]